MKAGLENAGRVQRAWRTKDLLMAGLLGVVFAIVIIGVNYVYMLATSLTGPIYSRVLIGFYMMPGFMALYLIRKPGAGVLAELVTGLVMIPFTSYGWMMLIGQAINGLYCELPYAVARYRTYSGRFMLTAAAVTGALAVLSEYPLTGYANLSFGSQVGLFAVTAVSCALVAWLSRALCHSLMQAGLLTDYRASLANKAGR
ncbi:MULTISPECIES: ECF transporter S component [Brevibacillus]|uniref:ECF transporter S component n=1 Tax=Brevibacillus TaxID=55080 RepID=UPI000ED52ABD|nr:MULTISPECIES: ECF transporter S component [Brevibacillus]WDV93361.1 ECF transporter S component [Brevibacillus parabrevis]HBZ80383.1 thiamine ABC transporter permease [Brevibacillus sp.]